MIKCVGVKIGLYIGGRKMKPIKGTSEIRKAVESANAKLEQANKTPTIDLLNNEVGKKIKEIAIKYGKNLSGKNLDDEELYIIKKYLEILNDVIKQDMTMCKVFPQSEIKNMLNLKKDLVGFFCRKADIDNLLNNSINEDYLTTLYEGLRLDYLNSKFKLEDDYIGMLIVKLPKFALRTPLDNKVFNDFLAKRRIFVENNPPYSGIGLIANEFCIPEFYISITNESRGDKKKVFDSFPLEAFCAEIKIVGHKNDIISLASYDAGDFECASDDKFIIYDKQKDFAKQNGWI